MTFGLWFLSSFMTIFLGKFWIICLHVSLLSTFKACEILCWYRSVFLPLDLLSWISCFSSLPSSVSCSWNFPNNDADNIVDRLFFSDIIVVFGCHSLVKDLSTFRLSSSLVKVLPRAIKWLVKCSNLLCKSRIDSPKCIPNNSYSWHKYSILIFLLQQFLHEWLLMYHIFLLLLCIEKNERIHPCLERLEVVWLFSCCRRPFSYNLYPINFWSLLCQHL